VHDDRLLFEHICLEGFQAGLSWSTVLNKRPAFRRHFHDFDIARVARLSVRDIESMMSDPGIIRNRAKIEAAIGNATVTHELLRSHAGALDELLWSFAPQPRKRRLRARADVPAITAEAEALSKELRQRGVDQESIDLALEGITDESEYRTAFELGMRKLSTMSKFEPDVQIRRIESLLARKGFGYTTITRVMRELDLLN
jgi:DNA-3-methyladenine glycosylase I